MDLVSNMVNDFQPTSLSQWESLAEERLSQVLSVTRSFLSLRKRVPAEWEVSLYAISASKMAELNGSYRQKSYATDILSFPSPSPFYETGCLGELVFCPKVLKRQAGEYGHSLRDELDILLVHGVLHLLGFDHEQGGRAAAQMEKWEAKVLQGLGLSSVKVGAKLGLINRSRTGKTRT